MGSPCRSRRLAVLGVAFAFQEPNLTVQRLNKDGILVCQVQHPDSNWQQRVRNRKDFVTSYTSSILVSQVLPTIP